MDWRRSRNGVAWDPTLDETTLRRFDEWLAGQRMTITLERWITTGKSGSPVAIVTRFVKGVEYEQLVLKFFNGGPDEAGRMQQAYQASEEFRAHLVEIKERPILLGDRWMVFQKIAGGDLSEYLPLVDHMFDERFGETCGVLTASVLRHWNGRPKHPDESATPYDYVRGLLKDRRIPKLQEWARVRNIGMEDHIRLDRYPGWLPNPLAFAMDPRLGGDEELGILRGNALGDLNVRNVILPAGRAERFVLIDTGGFADDAPLAYDPVYLLLSIATEWFQGINVNGAGNWRSLVEVIVDCEFPAGPHALGYKQVSAAIHEAGIEWAKDRGFGETWRKQTMLSLISCGLIFATRRRVPREHQDWFFVIAALAAREYLKLAGREFDGPPDLAVKRSGPYGGAGVGDRDVTDPAPGASASRQSVGEASGRESNESGQPSDEPSDLETLLRMLEEIPRQEEVDGLARAAWAGAQVFDKLHAIYPAWYTAFALESIKENPRQGAQTLEGLAPGKAAEVLARLPAELAVDLLVEMDRDHRKATLLRASRSFLKKILRALRDRR